MVYQLQGLNIFLGQIQTRDSVQFSRLNALLTLPRRNKWHRYDGRDRCHHGMYFNCRSVPRRARTHGNDRPGLCCSIASHVDICGSDE